MPTDYLVEMEFTPFSHVPTPQEALSFAERFVQPTLVACQRLLAAGRILAGGTALAATRFVFIARSDSPPELEDMLAALPLWPRAQTRVVPLGTFENRARIAEDRIASLRTHLAGQPAPAASPSPRA